MSFYLVYKNTNLPDLGVSKGLGQWPCIWNACGKSSDFLLKPKGNPVGLLLHSDRGDHMTHDIPKRSASNWTCSKIPKLSQKNMVMIWQSSSTAATT